MQRSLTQAIEYAVKQQPFNSARGDQISVEIQNCCSVNHDACQNQINFQPKTSSLRISIPDAGTVNGHLFQLIKSLLGLPDN